MIEYITCTCPACEARQLIDKNYMVVTDTPEGQLSLRVTDNETGSTAFILLDDDARDKLATILLDK